MRRKVKIERIGAARIGAGCIGARIWGQGGLGRGGSGWREPKEERCGDGGEDECDGVEGDGVGMLV